MGWARVSVVPHNPQPLPDFTRWPSFPFEGDMRVKRLAEPVAVEPPRSGEDAADCVACNTPDDAYIWISERWRVRGMDRPTGLPMVLILECRSHFDIGDLPNLLAAELGVMTVRLERAIRSLDGVARVHVNRWGDGSAHLHMWFLARPYGRLQLRGTFLSLWDDLLPVIPEEQWLENLALVAEWLAGFGGRAIAEPPHIHWQSPSTFGNEPANAPDTTPSADTWHPTDSESDLAASGSASRSDVTEVDAEARDHSSYATANDSAWAATSQDDAPDTAGAPADAAPLSDRPAELAQSPEQSSALSSARPSANNDSTGNGSASDRSASEDGLRVGPAQVGVAAGDRSASDGSASDGSASDDSASDDSVESPAANNGSDTANNADTPTSTSSATAASPEAQTPEQPGASSATTTKAEAGQPGDAAGTGTAAPTANNPAPPQRDSPSPADSAANPGTTRPVPAQYDPKATDSLNEAQDENADPKVVATASDKTTATNAAG